MTNHSAPRHWYSMNIRVYAFPRCVSPGVRLHYWPHAWKFRALSLSTTRVSTRLSALAHLGCNITDNARYTIPPLLLHTVCQWVPGTISNKPLLHRNSMSALHTRATNVFMTIDPATLRGRIDPFLSYLRDPSAPIPLQEIMASCRFTSMTCFSERTIRDTSGVEARCAIYLS